MLTIKIALFNLRQSIYKLIDEELGSDFYANQYYAELYIKPKNTPIYIKTKQGKKTVYKEIDHFYSTDEYCDQLSITCKDNYDSKESIEFDYELIKCN